MACSVLSEPSHSRTAAASLAVNLESRSLDITTSTPGSRVGKNLQIRFVLCYVNIR